jgi:hypothetical protein
MNRRGLGRVAVVIAICAFVGALAGIAGTAAAPSKSNKAAVKKAAKRQMHEVRRAFRGGFMPGPAGPGFGPVHAEVVVPNQDGTGFLTITTDTGTLNSVDGTTVHLKEGTTQTTYKDDAAIDVGSGARVIRNGANATLSDLKQGDHVRVITGAPKGNVVIAADDAFIQQRQKDHEGWRDRFFGPKGRQVPPPGAPGDKPAAPPAPPAGQGGSNQNGSNSFGPYGSGANS